MSTETVDEGLDAAAELVPGRGGWNGWALRFASPELLGRVRQMEAEEAREQRWEQERGEQDRERLATMALRASVLAAQARGEAVDAAQVARDGGVARTRDEAVAYYSQLGDQQDRQREAQEQRQLRSLLAEMDEHQVAEHVGRPRPSLSAAQAAVAVANGTARTPREAIDAMSAAADLEDALGAAQVQREIRLLRDGVPGEVALDPDAARAKAVRDIGRRLGRPVPTPPARTTLLAGDVQNRSTASRPLNAWVIR